MTWTTNLWPRAYIGTYLESKTPLVLQFLFVISYVIFEQKMWSWLKVTSWLDWVNVPKLAIQMSGSQRDHLILARLAEGKTTMKGQKTNLEGKGFDLLSSSCSKVCREKVFFVERFEKLLINNQKEIDSNFSKVKCFFKKKYGPSWASCCLFSSFSNKHYNFHNNKCE